MRSISGLMASAAVGGLVLLFAPGGAFSQEAPAAPQVVERIASRAPGSIQGIVRDEKGVPLVGAMVSATGAATAVAVTDRGGRFLMRTLSPGPYLVRAHLSGFVASRGQIVDVRPSVRASSAIALRRVGPDAGSYRVLAAGVGVTDAPAASPDPSSTGSATDEPQASGDDDHGGTAWRIRHARRGILKDATIPDSVVAWDGPTPETSIFGPISFAGRAVGAVARSATSVLSGLPLSGQLNLLTTGSFDSPEQLFTTGSYSRGVAYVSVGAGAGDHADWAVRGALTQGDISSWIVAGSYVTRTPARHRYDIGLAYSTQRYAGGNTAALRAVTDGTRNAGSVYGFDTWTIAPAVVVTYGGRYARYDYLGGRSLLSPRIALTIRPAEHFRIKTLASRRALAPGAEEFLPPAEGGIWMPPQRTFSSLNPRRSLEAERADHVEVGVEHDLNTASTISLRAFRQHVGNQLVTMFGVRMPGDPMTELGHYFVANGGYMDASGWSAGFRLAVADRVRSSVEYTASRAHWTPADDLAYMMLLAPSAIRTGLERIQDVSTSVETAVPETATRVIVLYRVSSAFAHREPGAEGPAFDSRFDVQVRQSLPFMNFSTAQWEMLLAVRNFFRETAAEQSLYDELLVVRPPKRIVGGLTLRF